MPELTVSHALDVPGEAVWRLLEDFGAIQQWWPTDVSAPIERVTLEGQGIGMVRHIHHRGAAHPVSERLDFIDPSSRTLVLSIVGIRPLGITAYLAEGHVVDLSDQRCRIDYRALITTRSDLEEQVLKAVRKTWSLMFRGLEAAAKRSHGKPAAI